MHKERPPPKHQPSETLKPELNRSKLIIWKQEQQGIDLQVPGEVTLFLLFTLSLCPTNVFT